jgi:hypothetical protein
VSFISPFAGFALGIVFLSQVNDQPSRNFGRHCMILMGASLMLIALFLIVSVIMSVMGMGADYAGPNIGEGYY